MRVAHTIKRFWANLFRRNRAEDTLDAELRAYVAELTDRNLAAGMAADEARRQALVEAGGIEQVKEEVRDAWLGQGILTAAQDVRLACRSLRRTPAFAAIVVATLTLGMGATLTMYSLMRGVLWRPLPYPEPDRIAAIQVDARNVVNAGAALGEVLDLKERGRSFERVAMIDTGEATVEYMGESERVAEARVSDDLLPLLGARLALGRALEARTDDRDGPGPAILISDELWRRRFASAADIVGRTVRINDADVRIAGVLTPGFRLFLPPSVSVAERIDVWFSFAMSTTRRYRNLPVLARLRPGVTIRSANAELQTLAAQFEREHPEFYSGAKGWQASPSDRNAGRSGVRFTAKPLHEEITRDARPALVLLAAAVAFVFLIACANVANLMLARGTARQRELAIRRALGASHFRIARQLFLESLVLAGGSACLGLLCARFGLEAIGNAGASQIPLQSRIGLDVHAALIAVVIAVGTSLAFGLLPAWRLTSGPADQPLRASRAETAGRGARRLQRMLVALEVALSMMPLVCGGLMLRSFVNLLDAPLGFDPANVVTAQAPFSVDRYPRSEQQWAVLGEVMDRVRAIPGVQAVSAASPLPLAPNQEKRRVGRADRPDDPPILATQQGAMPGYLGVTGTALRAGRDFTDDDVTARRNVVMIDERLARRLWPEEGAIGKRLTVYRTGWRSDLEVVGVTAAVRATRVRDENIPHFMMPSIETSLVIKTRETAERMTPGIQLATVAAHTGRAAFDIRPMSAYVADSIGDTRFVLFVLMAFAGLSVVLTAVGLYGTLAYLTAQRTREFGVRLALGSSAKGIVGIVVAEGVWLAAAGVGLGLVGAVAVARTMRELLYGVGPLDGATMLGVVSVVAVVALAAAGVPAWRAARTDPQAALRSE